MKMTKAIFYFLIFSLSIGARAEQTSSQIVDPLKETQQVLRNKDERQKAIGELGDKAKSADAYAEKVVGSEHKDSMYDISADLMELLQTESGGDPDKMMKILSEAQQNPEEFYNRFPAAQKEKIQRLIDKMPKASKP